MNFVKSGNIEITANFNVEQENNNPLRIGIYNGHLTIFDKSGHQISGVTRIDILTTMNDLVTINIKCMVHKDFLISDPIKFEEDK